MLGVLASLSHAHTVPTSASIYLMAMWPVIPASSQSWGFTWFCVPLSTRVWLLWASRLTSETPSVYATPAFQHASWHPLHTCHIPKAILGQTFNTYGEKPDLRQDCDSQSLAAISKEREWYSNHWHIFWLESVVALVGGNMHSWSWVCFAMRTNHK